MKEITLFKKKQENLSSKESPVRDIYNSYIIAVINLIL